MSERYKRIRDYSLSPAELMLFSDNRWINIQQAKAALNRIRKKYLTEEEIVLLELKSAEPPRQDKEVAEILRCSPWGASLMKRKLYNLIVGYSWWLQNKDAVIYLVNKRLGKLHKDVLLQVIKRKGLLEISENLDISYAIAWKRMNDNIRLLRHNEDFKLFMRSLRRGYWI